ncbi:YjiG family protein [Candidatus Pantoea persica]|uniref:YjiG family protein n=1 Tax=Candidatus Pantoea persica TaxID=2518128 RepID=UPI00215D810F|nr:YjiG family protein [Candidatus Pantoea persica]MBA2816307.1 Inner membrane protein YjiG [Candidatus Pantoea persica]
MENNGAVKVSQNPFDIFVTGARKGFHITIHNLMPNMVMAYVLAEVLNLLGIMPFLGQLFAPVMGLFGLPGEAITVLLTTWLSSSVGTGVAVSLLSKGLLTGEDITILAPAIFLMGSQLPYMGRLRAPQPAATTVTHRWC